MQDKRNSEGNQALVDKAWLQMQEQLDVAMPQRKRRPVWWWWAGAIGVGVLLLTAFLMEWRNTNPQLPVASSGPEVVAEVNDAAPVETEKTTVLNTPDQTDTQTTKAINTKEERPALLNTTIEKRVHIEEPGTSSNQKEGNEKTVVVPIASAEENLTKITEEPVGAAGDDNNGTLAEAENSQPERVASSPASAAEVATGNTRAAVSAITPLPAAELTPLPYSIPVKTPTITAQAPGVWHYYLETLGGFSLTTTDYYSFAAGVGIQRDLGRKFRAELGLQYQLNSRSLFTVSNDTPISAEEFTNSFGGQYALNVSAAYQNLKTTRYNAYLGSTYNVLPRLSIGLGVQASYFSKAYAVFRGGSAAVAEPIPATIDDGLRVDLYEGNLSVYDLDTVTNAVRGPYPLNTNRWQWSMNTSVRYRFARHWEANLLYQRHLTAWPNENEEFGGLNALQLGVRFYLR